MPHNFVAYGSLMSHQSIRETIPDRHFTPVIIRGQQRIFDVSLGKSSSSDVLNVRKSRMHSCNGVLFQVTDSELRSIMKREYEYNLEDAKVLDFLTGKSLGSALLVADHVIAIDTNGNGKPLKSYFMLCREAAYHISRQFGKLWDATTYLSDGTPVSKWILKHPDYDTLSRKK